MAEFSVAPSGSSSNTFAVIAALVILAGAAAAVFYFNPHRVADFKVARVDTFAPRTSFGPLEGAVPAANGMHVLGAATTSTEDDLYVIAHVSLTDKLRLPIFLTGAVAHVTLGDGTQLESNLLSSSDLKRLQEIFPAIAQKAGSAISDGDEVAPGQTLTGSIVLPFPGQTADAWKARKDATLTLQLRNQEAQTAVLP